MKTTITTILLLTALLSKSQTYVKLPIWELEKDTITVGDSLWVGFKIVPPSVPTNTLSSFQLQLPSFGNLWSGNYQTLYANSYQFNATNTCYKKYLTIPLNATLGANKIYSSGGYSINVFIKPNIVTSIVEHDKNNIVSVKYYDIYGKEKPSQSEGLTIVITTYSNGYQTKQKVILSLQ